MMDMYFLLVGHVVTIKTFLVKVYAVERRLGYFLGLIYAHVNPSIHVKLPCTAHLS